MKRVGTGWKSWNWIIYDIWKWGSEAGKIVLYLDADTADAKTAAQILTDVRNAFDASGVSFRAIDLELQAGDSHFNVRNVSRLLLDQPSFGRISGRKCSTNGRVLPAAGSAERHIINFRADDFQYESHPL